MHTSFTHNKRRVIFWIIVFLVLPSSHVAEAGRYRQPAYVTNAYFTNKLISEGNQSRPDHIVNVVRARYKDTRGYLVLDLIIDKGTHFISIDLLDNEGRKFETHDFPRAIADKNDFILSLNLYYGGDLPDGGIFFKLFDKFENKGKTALGTFRILSDRW